jgi:hypothetical protein
MLFKDCMGQEQSRAASARRVCHFPESGAIHPQTISDFTHNYGAGVKPDVHSQDEVGLKLELFAVLPRCGLILQSRVHRLV